MKYFILILNLIYLWGIGKQLLHITNIKTLKDNVDKEMSKSKVISKQDRSIYAGTLIIISILPLLYLLFSAVFVNTLAFAIVCFAYGVWSVIDVANMINYIKEGTISKTFNSKLYKILSLPFDLIFAVFIMCQLFIKW